MLILISGPSAVGKNTIIEKIIERYQDFTLMKSFTTREKRASDDTIKVVYEYVSKEEFEGKISRGEMFEYSEVHGNYYGIPFENLDRAIDENFIKDIDVLGNIKIRDTYGKKTKVVSIFLDAPDEILKDRLEKRGETPDRVKKRMERNNMEREYKKDYDLVIENLELEKTLNQIFSYLNDKI